MLQLLLDEHISPQIARQLMTRRDDMFVVTLQEWEAGEYLGVQDEFIITAALEQRLTLVTYDQRTIVPLLKSRAEQTLSHAGVIFVDGRTLTPNNFRGLINALCLLWDAQKDLNWTDRVVYLTR